MTALGNGVRVLRAAHMLVECEICGATIQAGEPVVCAPRKRGGTVRIDLHCARAIAIAYQRDDGERHFRRLLGVPEDDGGGGETQSE